MSGLRSSPSLLWLRRTAETMLLPVWFGLLSAGNLLLLGPHALGVDARIYVRGAVAWLAGGNPWNASAGFDGNVYHYAAFPSTTVLFAPATLVPEDWFVAGWLLLGLGAAVWIVRVRLRMPWWWILFPPLTEGVYSGNPGIVLLAMLLSGNTVVQSFTPPLKLYAGVPLAAQLRMRALLGATIIGAATVFIAPQLWLTFLQDLPAITSRLLAESAGGYAANNWPAVFAATVIAIAVLAVIDREAAGWLAVPALWPASEFHYAALALPMMTPWLGALLALQIRGLPSVAILLYVGVRLVQRRAARRSSGGAAVDGVRDHSSGTAPALQSDRSARPPLVDDGTVE